MARPKKMTVEVISNGDELLPVVESKNITEFELNAEIVAGSLKSNAMELKGVIENELKNYTVEKYLDDPSAAAKDKATLNKLSDVIASKRKEISTAWNKPLDDFLDTMKTLEKSIKEASAKLKAITDEAENKEKEEKRKRIQDYFSTLDFTICTLDKFFNPKWLNKTVKMESIMLEIEETTERISSEFATLRSMQNEDSETLQAFYLETLDLNATLQKGNQLKANRERIQALQEAEKTKTPERKEIDKANEQWRNEKLQQAAVVSVTTKQNAARNGYPEPIMSFTLKLFGTKEQLLALRKYIDDNGIKYEKVGM